MLCTALAVLHTESLLSTPNSDHEIIRKVIKESRLPEYVDEDDERGSLLVIRDIVTSIIDGDVEYDQPSILKQIKLESTQSREFYNMIVDYLDDSDLPEEMEKRIASLNRQLSGHYFQIRQWISSIALKQSMGKAFGAFNGTEHRIDLATALEELKTQISTYTQRSHSKIPSLVSSLSTSKPEQFVQIFSNIAEKAQGNGLQTG